MLSQRQDHFSRLFIGPLYSLSTFLMYTGDPNTRLIKFWNSRKSFSCLIFGFQGIPNLDAIWLPHQYSEGYWSSIQLVWLLHNFILSEYQNSKRLLFTQLIFWRPVFWSLMSTVSVLYVVLSFLVSLFSHFSDI